MVREVTRLARDSMITETSSAGATPSLPDTTIQSQEKESAIKEKAQLIAFCAGDLRQMGMVVKTVLKTDRVVAVQEGEKGPRCSWITLRDGRLHLHTQQARPKPGNAYALEYSRVVDLMDSSSTVAFLDLSWGGSTRRRVYIRLHPDTELARRFLLLCTGERGPSYLNTKFLPVNEPAETCLVLHGRVHEKSTVEVGTLLLPELEDEEGIQKSSVTGQLSVCTQSSEHFRAFHKFGWVESGLEVVRRAVQSGFVEEMKVVDCGVELPV